MVMHIAQHMLVSIWTAILFWIHYVASLFRLWWLCSPPNDFRVRIRVRVRRVGLNLGLGLRLELALGLGLVS